MKFQIGVGRMVGGSFHKLTLVGDIFNVLNLMSADWGLTKGVSFYETRNLLRLTGYDTANDRGVYEYAGPAILGLSPEEVDRNLFSASDLFSRWRVQLGLRYDF